VGFPEGVRVLFSMEKNEAPDPIDVGGFGADAVALDAKVPADAVEKFAWRGGANGSGAKGSEHAGVDHAAAFAGARVADGKIMVVMDADLSHPPAEIPQLVAPLLADTADMVIGSRYVGGGTTPGWPLYRKAMSRVAAGAAYPLTGVPDSMCGFFAIRRERLLELAPHATGFKIAFEAIVRGGKGLRVMEVPIAFADRKRGASKMNLRIALLFGFRWLAAAGRMVRRRR